MSTTKASTTTAENRKDIAFIVVVLICTVLNPLNSSTLSVAMPNLLVALHATSSSIVWIVSGYYLGSAVAQPVMGKLGDSFGRSRFVYAGLLLMIITAILAPFSKTVAVFVVWRIVQAIGTSMIYPNAIGLLRERRSGDIGRLLGWIGTLGGIAIAVGPTLGGFLVDAISWHAIFWLNIPLCVLPMCVLWWTLPKNALNPSDDSKGGLLRIDWTGLIVFAGAVTAWLFWTESRRPLARYGIALIFAGVILTGFLIIHERRSPSPILPVRWFTRPQFAFSSAITVLSNVVMYCILYGFPILLETHRHFSATKSGILLLAFAGVLTVSSPLAGRLAQGSRRRLPLLWASIFLVCGTLLLCWIQVLPIFFIVMGLALIGVSFAISNIVIQKIVLESVSATETGQASGVYTLLRYVGTMASSILVEFSTSASGRTLFLLLASVSLVTMVLTFGLRDAHSDSAFQSR